MKHPQHLKIVGLGNLMLGDDGIGSCLAQYLSLYNDFILDGDAQGIRILGSLINSNILVFLDIDTKLSPGDVALEKMEGRPCNCEKAGEIAEGAGAGNPHRMPPAALVGYLEAMGVNVKAYLIAIGPKSIEPFAHPSREVLDAVPKVLELLRGVVAKYGYELRWDSDPKVAIENCYRRVLG